MASTYLTRTNGSAPTNTTKATVSCWHKKGGLGDHQGIFGVRNTGNNNINVQCGYFNGTYYMWYKDGSTDYYLQDCVNIPRDMSAWYHIVFRFDTTQGAAADRLRIYVNGQDLGNSNFSTKSNPTSNDDIIIGTNGLEWSIGRYTFTGGSHQYLEGAISHFHYCDGYSYGPDSFGSTDATTGEWKINTAPSVTYGNNGFFVLKDSNSGTDQSGNSNNLTVGGGTLTKTEDCPSNNFAVINALYNQTSTIEYGNLKNTNSSNKFGGVSTIGVSSGKWYAEFKYGAASSEYGGVGIFGDPQAASAANQGVGKQTNSYSYRSEGSKGIENTFSSFGDTYASGDIIGVALDLDNDKLYFSKNGTWQNSGDPTSGSTGTGAIPISLTSDTGFWFMAANCNSSSNTSVWEHNYGNGYFGTTAVSSAGTNASNLGIFEYDVPAGYTALCTKGLNL